MRTPEPEVVEYVRADAGILAAVDRGMPRGDHGSS
jgi:hypothetical protein